jgi:hypothetical protein
MKITEVEVYDANGWLLERRVTREYEVASDSGFTPGRTAYVQTLLEETMQPTVNNVLRT